ncbi:MAG TPA: 3-methyl-2-oxobutanoate dehydrogenase subunit beta [Syntrophales bacterium]|nr:3-methyl-2-oxobutanoate dehydrogenase subunit beta [Syntrophales bacterium]HON23839.1 3-methyl-2-oxobutanoate dehydrogenase subunit beta [Syntrophales bacterium]HOU77494.1 3-methyl-2-oxobutanoate dehydrogenase subunit beta [Syntrophales bacterium]HPC31832.1 3-methyl-2-oxobutanoate dehydrogenase subunit beta [Syntrophales bacterium]HQG33477.1 3-methyl-2-oxobutanoate dehydrogenase subunit beta [Syntrophales bacterium]
MQLEALDRELMCSGHVGCPGCGATIAMRFMLKALGEKTVLVLPACCWSVIAGPYPQSSLKIPVIHTAFETGGATASGVRAALDMKGDRETTVVTWAGDGGTFDIGFQALSGAVERNEDFIYMCYDNEAYMNTGIQRSSSTPYGAWTTTTTGADWKKLRKKNIVEALVAHRIPYAATANIAFPEDLVRKVKKAKEVKGSRFLHIYASCPTGWRIPSEMSIKIARMAVQTNIFPLYEVENGVNYTINVKPREYLVREYFKLQGRFRHLSEADLDQIQAMVNEDWELLLRKAGEHA